MLQSNVFAVDIMVFVSEPVNIHTLHPPRAPLHVSTNPTMLDASPLRLCLFALPILIPITWMATILPASRADLGPPRQPHCPYLLNAYTLPQYLSFFCPQGSLGTLHSPPRVLQPQGFEQRTHLPSGPESNKSAPSHRPQRGPKTGTTKSIAFKTK